MSIPVPWATALAVAGAMGGGLTGFMALAFPPAWPLLAAVVGMLVVRAVRARRILDIGLLMAGFGSAWTLLLGISILNVMTDPAVTSQDETGVFAFAAAVLLAGLAVAIAGSVAPAERKN